MCSEMTMNSFVMPSRHRCIGQKWAGELTGSHCTVRLGHSSACVTTRSAGGAKHSSYAGSWRLVHSDMQHGLSGEWECARSALGDEENSMQGIFNRSP